MYEQWAQLEELLLNLKLCNERELCYAFEIHTQCTLNTVKYAAITDTCTPVSCSCFNLILSFLYNLF